MTSQRNFTIASLSLAAVTAAAIALIAAAQIVGTEPNTTPTPMAWSAPGDLTAGPYRVEIGLRGAIPALRGIILLSDQTGRAVPDKPVTGILAYQGTASGHDHHEILISKETEPGRYELDLRGVVPGVWVLTIAIGDEGRTAYPFAVR